MMWIVSAGGLACLYMLYRVMTWFMAPLLRGRPPQQVITETYPTLPVVLADSTATVDLSIIAPAFNEESRLPRMLEETFDYLQRRKSKNDLFSFEVIVVDDGSTDRTTLVARELAKIYGESNLQVLSLKKNVGKGGAVQRGMLRARGKLLLMADSDAATRIDDLDFLEEKMKEIERNGCGIVVGSRAHLEDRAVASRKWYRNITMYGFHFLVSTLGVRGIKDTQCGFKLFTRNAAQWVFANQRLERWVFDAELLMIARSLGIPIAEVAVNWHEVPGSKLNIVNASLEMARDLLWLRICYSLKIWTISTPKSLFAQDRLKSS